MIIKPSDRTLQLARDFLSTPSDELETECILSVNHDLTSAGQPPLEGAYVEERCVEHGILHIFTDNCPHGTITVCPRTNLLETNS